MYSIKNIIKNICRYILREEIEEYENSLSKKDDIIDKLYSTIHSGRVNIRLPRETFSGFKRLLQESVVSSTSTDLQVAYLVGQQRVLDLMERELVHG